MNDLQAYAKAVLGVNTAEDWLKQKQASLDCQERSWNDLDDSIARHIGYVEMFTEDDFWKDQLQALLDEKAAGYDAYMQIARDEVQKAQIELDTARAKLEAVKLPEVMPIPEIIPLAAENEVDTIVIFGKHFSAKAMVQTLKDYRRGDVMQIGGILVDIAKFRDFLKLANDDVVAFSRKDDYLILEHGRSYTMIKHMAWIRFSSGIPKIGKLLAIGFANGRA